MEKLQHEDIGACLVQFFQRHGKRKCALTEFAKVALQNAAPEEWLQQSLGDLRQRNQAAELSRHESWQTRRHVEATVRRGAE